MKLRMDPLTMFIISVLVFVHYIAEDCEKDPASCMSIQAIEKVKQSQCNE